jgi:uncharacterized protein (DUF4415 family)
MKKATKQTGKAGKIVQWESQPGRRLSKAERAELESLAALPDNRIDTADIPELPKTMWRNGMVMGKFYRPVKRPVTMRLDADVIEWLKAKAGREGRGYQTAANQLLRSRMISEFRASAKAAK